MAKKKPDKPFKIELPYKDALEAFMRTTPPEKKKKSRNQRMQRCET